MLARANREAAVASRPAKVLVWDLVVRLLRGIVVLGCLADLFVFEEGEARPRWVGYAGAIAVIVRVIWGFVGLKKARFADFVPSPSKLARYLADLPRGRKQRFLGHNPAGAMMMLAGVSATSRMLTLDVFFGHESLEDLHKAIADSILILTGVHAAPALFEGWRHSENLVLSMITGYKRA